MGRLIVLPTQAHIKMSLDLYTRNIPLTQKAKFWGNYVSALKGNADLCAAPEARVLNFYPSITQTIPPTYPDLRNEFGKLDVEAGQGQISPNSSFASCQ